MTTVEWALNAAAAIRGAFAVALVDYDRGMILGSRGGGPEFDLDVAADGNSAVLRAELDVMAQLRISESVEDILITAIDQYHVIRPVGGRDDERIFFYLALDRDHANLAMARRDLRIIADRFHVDDLPVARTPDGGAELDSR